MSPWCLCFEHCISWASLFSAFNVHVATERRLKYNRLLCLTFWGNKHLPKEEKLKVIWNVNFKLRAMNYTRSSAVWFRKQSRQMRLSHSSQAILHQVTFLCFKQRLQRPLLYDIGQCPPSIRTELADNFLAEKSPIKFLIEWRRKASWVLFLWRGDNFSKMWALTIQMSTRNHRRQSHYFLDFLPVM